MRSVKSLLESIFDKLKYVKGKNYCLLNKS